MSGPRDEPYSPPSAEVRTEFSGAIWDVRSERFTLPEASAPMTRQFIAHPGAVAIAAVDDQGRVLLIQQYRHPVLARDWEVPAGLLDVGGEGPVTAAARELYEEADLAAESWAVLADLYTSPGSSAETIRIFLARGLSPVPESERHERSDEELGIVKRWTPLSEALDAVTSGGVLNSTTQLAVMHAAAAHARGWEGLRPAGAPWPALEQIRAGDHARVPRD